MGRSAARCDICAAEFAVPGPFPVILATLSAPSIASATMCSMCRCGVTCSENVRDACRTPPDAPLRPDAKRAFPLLPRTLASRFGKINSPAARPHIPIVWSPPPLRPHDPYSPYSPLPVLADDGAARRAVCGGYLRDKKEVDGLRAPSRATARKAAHGAASIA